MSFFPYQNRKTIDRSMPTPAELENALMAFDGKNNGYLTLSELQGIMGYLPGEPVPPEGMSALSSELALLAENGNLTHKAVVDFLTRKETVMPPPKSLEVYKKQMETGAALK